MQLARSGSPPVCFVVSCLLCVGEVPCVWSLLDGGGYGSAKITYPCLLPLFSKLAEKVRLGSARAELLQSNAAAFEHPEGNI